ncbi:AbrB/MazE/SpoVT family DNA-binding domain-containing protein [Skermania piniformis]|uniref:AbrB/MazE/SpoVT family DNA-binding domain-containing protein n=1 Tax=Skermania pinensis TaxID=39122 RepID=A0ABX8S9N3_9ACTN|nr:AbrB/MazE/SpoVT family DNA-binding domain-containing protein [Skermania piniformis]QXQ14574.1 AbrB/MazE/SpoVT family DNA-binding domain-containing protein [Skermania piniformis]
MSGQVTIPQDIRRRLGIESGSEVDFVVDGDAVRLVRCVEGKGKDPVEHMRGRCLSMTTDEIMALTRSEA